MDVDSIKNASKLVNSILLAKGYLQGSSDDEEDPTLLFQSIDTLKDEQTVYNNDKLVINTIYSLLQELDKSKQEKLYLKEQLSEKTTVINQVEISNKALTSKSESLLRNQYTLQNHNDLLKQQLKHNKIEKSKIERSHINERNLNVSLNTKYEIEIKRKNITINQLQEKLLNKRRNYNSYIIGNNHHSNVDNVSSSNEIDNLINDEETEKVLFNLNKLITNLVLQNDSNIKFIRFITNYLTILNDYILQKNFDDDEYMKHLPPTPKFYHDLFEKEIQQKIHDENDDQLSRKINNLIDFDQFQPVIFESLNKLYDSLTNDSFEKPSPQQQQNFKSSSNLKTSDFDTNRQLIQLKEEIESLRNNLKSAIETNEKWSKKFQSLN